MKIILSNFYDNFLQNKNFINAFYSDKNINICAVYGSFPHCFLNSEVNNNRTTQACVYQNMSGCLKEYNKMDAIILDYGNLLIESKDFHNRHIEVQLEFSDNYDNLYFAVANLDFIKYIIEKFPKAKIILHYNLTSNLSIQEINELLKNKNIHGVICNDSNKLNKIQDCEFKIYYISFYNCKYCNRFEKCKINEQKYFLEYSEKSEFNRCELCKILDWETIKPDIESAEKANCILFGPPQGNEELYYNFLFNALEQEGDINND